jgi:hypothetical protein
VRRVALNLVRDHARTAAAGAVPTTVWRAGRGRSAGRRAVDQPHDLLAILAGCPQSRMASPCTLRRVSAVAEEMRLSEVRSSSTSTPGGSVRRELDVAKEGER